MTDQHSDSEFLDAFADGSFTVHGNCESVCVRQVRDDNQPLMQASFDRRAGSGCFMAKTGDGYTDQQLADMLRKYAALKGLSTEPNAIKDRVQAWRERRLGPVCLAIEYHETGIDPKPQLVNKTTKFGDARSSVEPQTSTERGTGEITNAQVVDTWHFWAEIVGIAHRNADGTSRAQILDKCTVGERVYCVREPNNPHDTNAIIVKRKSGEQLGYLPRDLARKLTAELPKRRQYVTVIDDIRNEGQRIQPGGSEKIMKCKLLVVVAEPNVSNSKLTSYLKDVWRSTHRP